MGCWLPSIYTFTGHYVRAVIQSTFQERLIRGSPEQPDRQAGGNEGIRTLTPAKEQQILSLPCLPVPARCHEGPQLPQGLHYTERLTPPTSFPHPEPAQVNLPNVS